MSDMTLAGLCGSLRADSLNRKLMMEAARAFGGRHECRHTVTRRFGFTDDADARDVRERADADARARHARVDAARVSTRVDARASGG